MLSLPLWEGLEYAHHTKQENYFLKIDFDKAYDRIEWDLILNLVKSLGIGPRFAQWLVTLFENMNAKVVPMANYMNLSRLRDHSARLPSSSPPICNCHGLSRLAYPREERILFRVWLSQTIPNSRINTLLMTPIFLLLIQTELSLPLLRVSPSVSLCNSHQLLSPPMTLHSQKLI